MSEMQTNYERWMKQAKEVGATHFLDVCDTWDYDHYPVYVMPGEDVDKKKEEYDSKSMQSVYATYKVN